MSHYGIFFVLVNKPVNSGKNTNVVTVPGGHCWGLCGRGPEHVWMCTHRASRSMQQMSNKTSHFLFARGRGFCLDPGEDSLTVWSKFYIWGQLDVYGWWVYSTKRSENLYLQVYSTVQNHHRTEWPNIFRFVLQKMAMKSQITDQNSTQC